MNVCSKCGCDIWPDDGCSCPGGSPSGWRKTEVSSPTLAPPTLAQACKIIEALTQMRGYAEAEAFLLRAKERGIGQ